MVKRNPNESERPSKSHDVSEWYERCIEWLLRASGMTVQREPHMNGKTPDLLVTELDGPDVVIECLVKLQDPEHAREYREQGHHACGGDIRELHSTLYSRVEEKITKYRGLVEGRSYVVALYNDDCMHWPDTAFDLAFSAHVPYIMISADREVVDRGYDDAWSTAERSASLFQLYPHLSGLIYSRWRKEHYFLPNPSAVAPVSVDLFPFAFAPKMPIVIGEPEWEERAPFVADNYVSPPNTRRGQAELLMQAITRLVEHRRNYYAFHTSPESDWECGCPAGA
jgi:hypothetical protein